MKRIMPKYCTAPNCKNGSSSARNERKSFYKYPLNNPERLQLWLNNMGREEWMPSCHQYLCHEHFMPSCFTSRWGMRYLDNNAVPTIFDLSEHNKKRKQGDEQQRTALMEPQLTATQCGGATGLDDPVVHGCQPPPVKLHAVTVKSSTPSEYRELPALSGTGNEQLILTADIESVDTHRQTTRELVRCRDAGRKVVVVVDDPSSDVGEVCLDTAAHVIMDTKMGVDEQPHNLSCLAIVNDEGMDSMADRRCDQVQEGCQVQEGGEVQVVAYFERIPSVPSPPSSMPVCAVLPGLCECPLPSPGSLVLTLEKLVSKTVEGLKNIEEAQQCSQLEEHRCHPSRLSEEQLVATVSELQKRVKVLQQRHRRRLDKLLGLENLAAQLQQSNLLLEEQLQLMEKAYVQSGAAVSHTGQTLAILYEDNTSYLWTQTDESLD